MLVATVESAFVLHDRATRPIRRIRDELRELERDAARAGGRLDETFDNRKAKKIEGEARALHSAGAAAHGFGQELGYVERQGARTERQTRSLGGQVRVLGNTLRALQSIMRLVRWPALIAGLGLATQAVGGLTAGLVTLLPLVGDLAGTAGAAIPLVAGLGAAAVVTKLATKDLGDALGGNAEALKRLTPEGRAFLETLKSYGPIAKELRRDAQQGLFPGLGGALSDLRRQRATARTIVRNTAGDLGNLARDTSRQVATPAFGRDAVRLAEVGSRTFGSAARGGFQFGRALMHIGIAAEPFTDWLGRTVEDLGIMAEREAFAARETGRLERFFDRARSSLERVGSVGENVWGAIGGTLRAARGEGEGAWESIDKLTGRWEEWATSAHGQMDMRRYFLEMRPVVKESAGLVGDIAESIADISRGPEAAGAIHELREAIPDLTEAVRTLTTSFGPSVVRGLVEIAELFATLTQHGGGLVLFVDFLTQGVSLLNAVLRLSGPVGTALVAAFGARVMLRRIGLVQSLAGAWAGVTGNARGAARAQRGAGGGFAGGGGGMGGARGGGGPGIIGVAMGGRGAEIPTGRSPGGVILPAGYRGAGGPAARTGGAGLIARARAGAASAYGRARAPGSARAFGGGAARLLGPTALLSGLIGASGPGLDFQQRLQGALALGGLNPLVPMPRTQADRDTAAGGAAQQFIGGLPQGSGLGAQREGIQRLQSGVQTARGNDTLGDADVASYTQALRQELAMRRQLYRETVRQKRAELDRRSVLRARGIMDDLGKAFDIRARHTGPVKAMETTVGEMLSRLRTLRPKGRKVLAENTLAWARQMERANPQLRGITENLERDIVRTYRRMGRRVMVINGQILTGSKREWKGIQEAISTSTERARQEASAAFTAIQRQAVGSLRLMGFSPGEARKLVAMEEAGGNKRRSAQEVVRGGTDYRASEIRRGGGPEARSTRARGGRLPGRGRQDTVRMSDGGYGAPGEMVLNQHSEGDIDAYLAEKGLSVEKVVAGERKKHSAPRGRPRRRRGHTVPRFMRAWGGAVHQARQAQAGGGGGMVRVPGDPDTTGGRDKVNPAIAEEVASWIRRYHIQIGYAFDPGGGHQSPGHNVTGTALDVIPGPGGSWDTVEAGLRAAVGSGKKVLYGTNNVGIPWPNHGRGNHGHVEWGLGGAVTGRGVGAVAGLSGAGAPQQIPPLRAPRVRSRGLPGQAVAASTHPYAAALTKKINTELAAQGASSTGGAAYTGGGQLDEWLTEALRITGHFSAGNLAALRGRSMQESGGDPNAQNNWDSNAAKGTPSIGLLQTIGPTFDAYKLPGMGNIRNPVHNAVAAIRYMLSRYGHIVGPGGGGYALGGVLGPEWGGWHAGGLDKTFTRPTMIGVGDGGPERVRVTSGRGRGRGRGGPLVVLNDGAIRIEGGGDPETVRAVLREELDRWADMVVEELEDGTQEDEEAVLT